MTELLAMLLLAAIAGRVVDPQGNPVPAATIRLTTVSGYSIATSSDQAGRYEFSEIADGAYQIKAESPGLSSAPEKITVGGGSIEHQIVLSQLTAQHQSIVITANTVQPE